MNKKDQRQIESTVIIAVCFVGMAIIALLSALS
jgi:hypothetical protein